MYGEEDLVWEDREREAFLWLPEGLTSLITPPGAGVSEPGAFIFEERDWVFISVSLVTQR